MDDRSVDDHCGDDQRGGARGGVTLEPDRARAVAWTAVGLLATSLAGYAVASSRWLVLTAALTALCAVPTAAFLLQLVAPETWTLHVDSHGVHGTLATFRVDESFATLRAVELRRIAGEPVLVLLGPGDRRRRLLLPIGCDLERLRAVVARVDRPSSTP